MRAFFAGLVAFFKEIATDEFWADEPAHHAA